jgi:hypothetical protein
MPNLALKQLFNKMQKKLFIQKHQCTGRDEASAPEIAKQFDALINKIEQLSLWCQNHPEPEKICFSAIAVGIKGDYDKITEENTKAKPDIDLINDELTALFKLENMNANKVRSSQEKVLFKIKPCFKVVCG